MSFDFGFGVKVGSWRGQKEVCSAEGAGKERVHILKLLMQFTVGTCTYSSLSHPLVPGEGALSVFVVDETSRTFHIENNGSG